jgi:hypothetical protein
VQGIKALNFHVERTKVFRVKTPDIQTDTDATAFGGKKGRSNSNHTTRVPVDLQILLREKKFTENV